MKKVQLCLPLCASKQKLWPIIWLLLFAMPALSQTTINASEDTYLDDHDSDVNYGLDSALLCDRDAHILVKFSRAEIISQVSGSILTEAKLQLYITANDLNATETLEVLAVTEAWTEERATWNCGMDINPYNNSSDCARTWDGASPTEVQATQTVGRDEINQTLTFTVTDSVAAFLNSSDESLSWVIRQVNPKRQLEFGSLDDPSAQHPPRLEMNLNPGPSLQILSPNSTILFNEANPTLTVLANSDNLDEQSLRAFLDGSTSPLAGCTLTEDTVNGTWLMDCPLTNLTEGEHRITARVSSLGVSQVATAEVKFQFLTMTGLNGSTWLTGAVNPLDDNGYDGDFYLNTDTGNVFEKADNQWGEAILNLIGADGQAGQAGADGATGPQGLAGADGATGPQGLAGADGATGPQGLAGADGATGPQGSAGADGATGPQGPAGADGAIGPQGQAGADGEGSVWLTGATNPLDDNGYDGDFYLNTDTGDVFEKVDGQWGVTVNLIGPDGPVGSTGADGAQGPAGADGATGPQGPAGADGATGPQGPTGLAGADGATGPQGAAGADGATGPQGAAGADGATGPQGQAGATGPQGQAGATGPQGQAGADGATGPQGPTGQAGADGATGPQGPTGADGPQGAAGADGATGPQGQAGATGPQGAAGADGATGPQGQAGADGATGPQGIAGADGATGPQGQAGADGATGPQGPTGLAGADGATGPQGIAGADGPQGADGATGPQGPDGAVGPQGPTGGLPWVLRSNGNFGTMGDIAWNKGYVKLTTPINQFEFNMFSIKITGYKYGNRGQPIEIRAGGYAFNDTNRGLITTDIHTEGSDLAVSMGVEGDWVVIYLGDGLTESWFFDQFSLEYDGWVPHPLEEFQWEFIEGPVSDALHSELVANNTNRVYIDDSSGSIKTEAFKMPTGASSGYVLTTDSLGTGTWQDLSGATGPQGPAGADGSAGPQGIAGADGATGPQGIAGADGATGPQGIAGADGATGPQGPEGAVGPQGPTGGLPWVPDSNGNFREMGSAPWNKGYVKLTTPINQFEINMFSIKVIGYRYGNGGQPIEIRAGGYAYSDTSRGLIQTDIHTEGSDLAVSMGVEDDWVVIYLGDGLTETWYFDQFSLEYDGWVPHPLEEFQWEFIEGPVSDALHSELVANNTNRVYIDDSSGSIKTEALKTDEFKTEAFKMPTGASSGYVLTTDSSGTGTWQDPNKGTGLPWVLSSNGNFGGMGSAPGSKGIVKLITPINQFESNMFSIKVIGYRYGNGGQPIEIRAGGYAYSDTSSPSRGLIQTDIHTEGSDLAVSMGVENDWVVIYLGDGLTESWYFDQFSLEYDGWVPHPLEEFQWEFIEGPVSDALHSELVANNTNRVYIDDSAGSIRMTSPNGSCFQLKVDDNGALITEACP